MTSTDTVQQAGPATMPTVRRERVTWSRWDPDRMKTVTSHPWQYIVTEPDGYERCFDKRSEADGWISENYGGTVAGEQVTPGTTEG